MKFNNLKKSLTTNVKTEIKTAMSLTFFACLTFGIIIIFFLYDYHQSFKKAMVAQEIEFNVFEVKSLADEYIATHSARAKSQLEKKCHELNDKTNAHEKIFKNKQERALFFEMHGGIIEIERIFNQLKQTYESKQNINADILQQQEERLASQLLVNAQSSISSASELTIINNTNAKNSFQKIILFFSLSSIILISVLLFSFRIIWKSASELHKRKTEDEIILKSIGDGLVAIDRDWKITLWNNAASKITGWTREEAVGKHFRDIMKIIRRWDRTENIHFIEESIIMKESKQMESDTLLIRKDGNEIDVGDSASPLLDQNGEVIGAIIIFRDTTQERENQRLRSDFTYASHQLRTPVTKAMWTLESGMDRETLTEARNAMTEAYQSIQSISKLADGLIDISSIEQKMIIIQKTTTKLSGLFESILKTNIDKSAKNNIIINPPIIPATTDINTDSKLFKKIIGAILDNAIAYSKSGGIINIEVKTKDNDLIVKIEDFGIGILKEDAPLVFTKFFRGKNIDTSNIPGAGLSLYAAKEYAKLIGARIWFESKEKGTIFYATFPM